MLSHKLPILLAAALTFAAPAFAEDGKGADAKGQKNDKKDEKKDEKKDFPVVKPGGVIFAHYGLDLSDGANGANAFDLDRAYVYLKADLSPSLSSRITLDADRQKSATIGVADGAGGTTDITVAADTKTRVYVKHAYLEWKTKAPGVKVRFGMTDTAWAPYSDAFTGLRYISKSSSDLVKFVSTSDLGVQVMGEHAKGLVSWQAGVINGEGYGAPEIDASKTLQARLTVDPLAKGGTMNLPISGFFSQSVGGDGDAITLYGGGAGFKMNYLTVWAEYLGQNKGDVGSSELSVTLVPKVPKVINIIARFDRYDADGSASGDETTTLIGGVSHDFLDKVSGSVTFERAAVGDSATQGLFLRMQAGF